MPRPDYAPRAVHTATNSFANNTMAVRLPDIISQTIVNNAGQPSVILDALKALRDGMAANATMPFVGQPAPDYDEWAAMTAPYAGQPWHNTEWFFAEVYAYRLMMQAVRWWETGLDPFMPIKDQEEQSTELWDMLAESLAAHPPTLTPEERMARLVQGALWGNRIDLSFKWALERGTTTTADDLLVDHSVRATQQLLAGQGAVHLIADNYGREMVHDLVLIDALLDVTDAPVMLHLKFHPTFISDTTIPDFWRFMALARHKDSATVALVNRLQAAFDAGRFHLVADPYWNSTLPLWDMPTRLHGLFADARLVIFKGDLNYRRVVGDGMWPGSVPFSKVVSGFPAPVLCLRTMKSDPLAGLDAATIARLDALNPDWRWQGQYGLIQSNLPA